MIWRGNSSPAGWFNGNGWFRGGVSLGQSTPDVICEGDVCIPVVARLDPAIASSLYDRMKKAVGTSCFPAGGDKVLSRIEASMASMQPGGVSVGLTKADADAIKAFEACVASVPVTSSPTGSTSTLTKNIPWVPIGIGAGALILIGVLAS